MWHVQMLNLGQVIKTPQFGGEAVKEAKVFSFNSLKQQHNKRSFSRWIVWWEKLDIIIIEVFADGDEYFRQQCVSTFATPFNLKL